MTTLSRRISSMGSVVACALAILGLGLATNGASAHHNLDHKGGPTQSTTTSTTSTTTAPPPDSIVTVTLEVHEEQETVTAETWWELDKRSEYWRGPDRLADVPLPAEDGRSCQVQVDQAADGLAVLEAAISSGCIENYELDFSRWSGSRVLCLDGTCNQAPANNIATALETNNAVAVKEWSSFDGANRIEQLEGFDAAESDVLRLSYRTRVQACAPWADPSIFWLIALCNYTVRIW